MTSAKSGTSNSVKGRRTRLVSRRPAVEELESRLLFATFTVNYANDVDDGACSQQHCSLREAINAANVNPGKDVVAFGIPGDGIPTIHPRAELPVVTDRIVIDGTTQPAGRIEIDGSRTELAAGLSLQTGGSTVRGLVVNRFFYDGIALYGDGNVVQGNFLGTDTSGTIAVGNYHGVRVNGSNNTIGGRTPETRNLLSGNRYEGVWISFASGNVVQGNYIGTDVTGTKPLGNGDGMWIADASDNTVGGTAPGAGNVISGNNDGIWIWGRATGNVIQGNLIGPDATGTRLIGNNEAIRFMSASYNTVGGTVAGAGNVIAGNGTTIWLEDVSWLDGNTLGNQILGNSIYSNGGSGFVRWQTASNNNQPAPVIESAESGQGTTIRGRLHNASNRVYRVEFFSNPPGEAEGQSFLGFVSVTTDTSGDATFTAHLSATVQPGRFITATATDNTVGTSTFSQLVIVTGTTTGLMTFDVNSADDADDGLCDKTHCSLREAINAANALSGTDTIVFEIPGPGVPSIRPASQLPEIIDPIVIDGSTQPSGKVELDGSNTETVLGTCNDFSYGACGLVISAGDSTVRGMVINRFGSALVYLKGAGQNTILGNFIGTDVLGTTSFNWRTTYGILIQGENNVIGGLRDDDRGPCLDDCNLISGSVNGILIGGYNLNSSGNVVQGNLIGTDITGTARLENSIGVQIFGSNNTIGGLADGAGNLISGNFTGVFVTSYGTTAVANTIQGNLIGTDASGRAPLGNYHYGVAIFYSADNLIGGTAPGAGNTIAFNEHEGIAIASGFVDSVGNGVLSNSIFSNGRLGIELFEAPYGDGVSRNDPGDSDAGPNNLQNFPMLSQVTRDTQGTTIRGTLNSRSHARFRIEFFDNSELGPSGHGDGEKFIGSTDVVTDRNGNASFVATFAAVVPTSHFVTATATDSENNTSEFSPSVPPETDQTTLAVNSSDDTADGRCDETHCSLREAIIAANAFPGPHRIVFNIPVMGVPNIRPVHELPTIRTPVIIDGSTQPAGKVELDGSITIGGFLRPNGLSIEAGNSVVRGLVINRFRENGILLFGRGGNTIEGNYLGTDITGTQDQGNGNGITVASDNNTIGGPSAGARNVISGNQFNGIDIYGALSATGANRVQGNYIGTDLSGTIPLGNNDGIHLQGTRGNLIGGVQAGEGNIIAGDQYAALYLDGGADENLVQGNRIGVDVSCTAALGRTQFGVLLNLASFNTIGGTVAGTGNTIVTPHGESVENTDDRSVGNIILGNNLTLPCPEEPGTKTPLPRSKVSISTTPRGVVFIRGDAGDNVIEIEWTGPRSFVISPGEGTMLQNQFGPVGLVSGNVKRLRILTGEGNDTVRIRNVQTAPRITINTGSGNDFVEVIDSVIGEELALLSGPGTDRISLVNSHFRRQVFLDAIRRHDVLELGSSMFDLSWTLISLRTRFPASVSSSR